MCVCMINIVFRDDGFIKPNIGEKFIIHKPDNTHQRPTWLTSMDMYDGTVIETIGEGKDPATGGKCWKSKVIYKDGRITGLDTRVDKLAFLNSLDFMINYRWLEAFEDNFEEIDTSIKTNFFDI